MADPVIQDLNSDVDNLMEMESLCMKCHEQGTTRLMLTRIPFFREIIISSFQCEFCHHHDTGIQSGGMIQEKGVKYVLNVTNSEDLNRSVVKSDYAVISIPELDFEQPASRRGEINTIEGILESVKCGISLLQEERRKIDAEQAKKIDEFVQKIEKIKSLDSPFTFTLDDPTGNSCIENPHSLLIDNKMSEVHYTRTHEQDVLVGCCAEDDNPDPNWNFQGEVMTFQTNCPECTAVCSTNMKLIDIPFFKEVVIMATVCDTCGHRDNEVKGGAGIEPRGRSIKLLLSNKEDLSRDVLKSDTAGVKIPELDFEMVEGSLGGRFTTVEGLLTQIRDQLSGKNPFIRGDSSQDDTRSKVLEFCKKLEEIIQGEMKDIHMIIDDPAGNSYIQSLYAPDPDPRLTTEDYERSFEQNEALGLNDMKVENYADNVDH